ncbi:MAG: flippase [Bacteroidales bacterium]|nr:flippase [Bacteroidales bacterium]
MLEALRRKYDGMPVAAKAALWFTVCNFFLAGLGFITGPLFTRLLPPEEYGILTLYVTYEQIILILATWEIQVGAYQRGLFKYEGKWPQYSQSTLLLVNLLTIGAFLLVLLFHRPVIAFTRMSPLTLALLFVYLLFQPAYTCWNTRKRTLYDYKAVVGITVLYSLLNIIIPLLAVLFIRGTAAVKFNATLATSIAILAFFYFSTMLRRDARPAWEEVRPQWRYMIAYEAPLVLHSLSYLVLGQADRVMIGKMVGDREAAFYGVAYTLASAVTILQSSLNQALTPWRFHKLKEENYGIIGSTTVLILLFIAGAILAVVLIAPELMKLLFTDDYYEAVLCIPPVTVSVFFMFLYSTFVSVESYYEKTKYIMYVSVFCGLVNILLNYLLIPVFGYIVCGYTTLASYILFAVLHYYFMRLVCRKAIPGVRFFPMATILAISAAAVVCSVLITLLYPYWIARYALVLVILGLGFIYRKQLRAVWETIKAAK